MQKVSTIGILYPTADPLGGQTAPNQEIHGYSVCRGRSRTRTAPVPDVRQRPLLSEAAFVLEPGLDPLVGMFLMDFRARFGELFWNASGAWGSAWR